MARQRRLTLTEVIVLVGVAALIVHTLLNIKISRVRPVSKEVRCLGNLKQWGMVFLMYTDDNDGRFFDGQGLEDADPWLDATRHLRRSRPKILLCPSATKPRARADWTAIGAWKTDTDVGSYGLNGWIPNPQQKNTELRGRGPAENYWGALLNAQGSNNVPILADAMWFEGRPRHTDTPPDLPGNTDADMSIVYDPSQIRRFCVNRHEGHVNVLFVDFSVRKVGLKELWTLKWHRNYDSSGPWTSAGGVSPTDWPPWMRNFRDY